MEEITLGQIALGLTFIVGLMTSITYLKNHLHEWLSDSLKDQFEAIDGKFTTLGKQIEAVDMNSTKNFLVARLAEIEKGNVLDDIEQERFWEQWEHYSKIGGNSYIQRKVEQLKADGRL